MGIDDITPPSGDQIIVNKNGAVITSIDTLMKWTDTWLKTAEMRLMLSKRKEATWGSQNK